MKDLDRFKKTLKKIGLPFKIEKKTKGDLRGYDVQLYQSRKYLDKTFGKKDPDKELNVGLHFDLQGRFQYGYNWKE